MRSPHSEGGRTAHIKLCIILERPKYGSIMNTPKLWNTASLSIRWKMTSAHKYSSCVTEIQYRRMRFSTCLRQMGHSDMRSPHIWHVPWPQRKIMFLRRSRHTGHMVCSLMSCSCCCNFCMSELDVSRLPLFIRAPVRHTGSTGPPPVRKSSRYYFLGHKKKLFNSNKSSKQIRQRVVYAICHHHYVS